MSAHKRAISSSTSNPEPPTSKQRLDDATRPNTTLPEYVYIVVVQSLPAYGETGSDIRGVYHSLADATNCAKRISGEEYEHAVDVSRGTESDGRIYWRSSDVGEGDGAEITVEKHKLKPVGSEQAQEWPATHELGDENDDEDGEEDGEDDDGDE